MMSRYTILLYQRIIKDYYQGKSSNPGFTNIMKKKKNHSTIATIAISLLLLLTAIIAAIPLSLTFSPLVANGQPERPLPVLLIHGYRSTHNVWDEWEDRLRDEGIYTKAITFPRNDECGSAADHATQLNQIVRDF